MNNYLAAKKDERRSQTSEIRQQKEKGRYQQAEIRKKKADIRNQIAEGKRQKEVNKDLQDTINSFIIH